MFIIDAFGNPVDPPLLDPLADLGITYADLTLVVRDGLIPVPVMLAALGLEHEGLAERMIADGTLDADLKPVDPMNGEPWASDYPAEGYEDALDRVFAQRTAQLFAALVNTVTYPIGETVNVLKRRDSRQNPGRWGVKGIRK
jgi:hypothetical protein